MITIKSGEHTIYHPRNSALKLINPKLCLEDSAAGSLTFKIYSSNLNYASVKRLFPIITVFQDGSPIFKGRAIADGKDFYNGRTVEVEGKLAFFNDSFLEPFDFRGTPEELFRMVVENHNSQVMEWQRFKVGSVTVTDPNDYIVRSSENLINTWTALKEKCFKSSLGGHIRIRYEEDGDYVDWLQDYDKISAQSIEFAKNIVQLSHDVDASKTYTAIRPIGAEVDGKKVDISSVNNGKTYIIDEKKAEEYGIIFAPESESTWEDVTLPENLLKKAAEKLSDSMTLLSETYEIHAVDLNLTDGAIEALNICEYVPVISRPHEINGNYLLTRADIYIASPQNSIYYLGASRRVLSDRISTGGSGTNETVPKKISALENDAGYISEKDAAKLLAEYPDVKEVEIMLANKVSQIPSGENGLSAYEVATEHGFAGTVDEWLASLKGENGDTGEQGEQGASGERGPQGEAGQDGFSPTITENADNSKDIYRLDITTKTGRFTTPNLKGSSGTGSGTSSGSNGLFGFEIRSDGCLWIIYEDLEDVNRFYINADGELVCNL